MRRRQMERPSIEERLAQVWNRLLELEDAQCAAKVETAEVRDQTKRYLRLMAETEARMAARAEKEAEVAKAVEILLSLKSWVATS